MYVTMWKQVLIAFGLSMVLEGIWPFFDPAGLRKALHNLLAQDDNLIRTIGLISMTLGVLSLYVINLNLQ